MEGTVRVTVEIEVESPIDESVLDAVGDEREYTDLVETSIEEEVSRVMIEDQIVRMDISSRCRRGELAD